MTRVAILAQLPFQATTEHRNMGVRTTAKQVLQTKGPSNLLDLLVIRRCLELLFIIAIGQPIKRLGITTRSKLAPGTEVGDQSIIDLKIPLQYEVD
jgi:hypothetical protein